MAKIIHVYFGWSQTGYKLGWQRFDIITRELARAGNQLYVTGLAYRWNGWRDRLLGKIENKGFAMDLIPPRLLATLDVIMSSIGFLEGISQALMMLILIQKIKPDLVILQDEPVGFDFSVLLFRKLLNLKFKVIVDFQDLIVRLVTYGTNSRFRRWLGIRLNEVLNPKLADGIIVITRFGERYFNARGFKRIFVVRELVDPSLYEKYDPNYVELLRQKLSLNGDDIILLWIGGIGERALVGLKDVISGIGLSRIKHRVKLLIVGPGRATDINYLQILAKKCGVNVIFYGPVKSLSKEHIALYKLAHVGVFCLPEDLFTHFVIGTKLAEYLAAGLPVIAPKLLGPSEVVKGNGVLYKPGKPESFARALEAIVRMNLAAMGSRSREIAEGLLSPRAFKKLMPSLPNLSG